jgi:hypothetical protein
MDFRNRVVLSIVHTTDLWLVSIYIDKSSHIVWSELE